MNERQFVRKIDEIVNKIAGSPSDVETISKCYFLQCPQKKLREATLRIFYNAYKKLKANSSDILQNFLLQFQHLLKEENLGEEVKSQQVPDKLWRNGMKTCAFLNPSKILLAIDVLFNISQPESPEREESIRIYIQKAIEDEKTSDIGNAWKNIFTDLEKLKIIHDAKTPSYDQLAAASDSTKNEKNDDNSDDENIDPRFEKVGKIRSSNTRFPILCYSRTLVDENEEQVEGEKYENNENIKIFETDNDFDKFEKYFKIAMNNHKRIGSTCSVLLNNIFHINNPKTEKQRLFINEYVRKLIRNKQTFAKGIDIIHYFELYQLRDELNEEILYNSYFFKRRDAVTNLFTFGPHKERRLHILDNLLARALLNQLETEHEKRFVEFIGIKALPNHIWKLAEEDEMEMACIQRSCRAIHCSTKR